MDLLLILLGILAGPTLLSVATVALYGLFDPAALHDGQFRMFYLVTVPFGLLLGGAAGTSAWLVRAGRRREAGRCSLIGGQVVALLALVAWIPWIEFGPLEWTATLLAAGSLWAVGARMSSRAIHSDQLARLRTRFGARDPSE